MRRLPVYFLIDISDSMVGEPIEQVQDGIADIVKSIKIDPVALETVWLSIIGFAGKSKVLSPLQDIITFYPPKIPIGSGTSLSSGLSKLMYSIDHEVSKTTHEQKGDWKPIIFLFTDGVPTDNCDKEILNWNANYRNRTNLIIISIGDNSDNNLLGKLTDNILYFKNSDSNSYKEFFKWVSASIKSTSENINHSNQDRMNLNNIGSDIIEKIDLSKEQKVPDDNYVVLKAKCSSSKKLYLIKYKKSLEESGIENFRTRMFRLYGAYKIDETSYEEFSSEVDYSLKISSDELLGNPSCPCCGNQIGAAHCTCGGIHCISGNGEASCPWCGNVGFYGQSDGYFDINRTLG